MHASRMTKTMMRTTNSTSTTTRILSSTRRAKPPVRSRRSTHSSGPLLGNYRKALTFVGIGLLVETLFNVIMPLSLKFLIDDALGEEDFGVLVRILSVLAVAGIITSLISIWYERWDARLSSSIISEVRLRLFNHVQDLPSAFFARTKRGEILSRFSVDLSAFEGATETLANTALLPAMELIAGIILMLFLNWQLAVVALLIFPITLIGPRILTPKAVQANYEQKVNESAILGVVQENIAAQALVKAFSLQRRARGWFSLRNEETRKKIASSTFLSSMVERSVDGRRAAAAPRRSRHRRLSCDQRTDHHRNVRDI